jgi:SSS family transporter
MSSVGPLDVVVIVLYIVGTTALGVWFTRQQRDTKAYFVGDRNVGWWLVLISIVATETSTVTFLSVPGLAFNPNGGNLTFLQLALGYVVGRMLIAWLLLPQYFRGEWFTAYQLLRQRFNPAVQRTASGLFLTTRTIADGLRLFLTALLLHQFTGWDMAVSIAVMGLVTLVYTFLGGMQAVIWTDLIQFVIYILGAIIAGAFLLGESQTAIGGGAAIHAQGGWTTFLETGRDADKVVLFDFTWKLGNPYTFWAGLIGGAFFTMASHGADQIMVQRYLCSRTLGQARLALVASGVVVFVQFLLFLLIGVGLYVLYTNGGLPLREGTRNDEVFGIFIVRYLPTGVIGLVIAAVLAAAMSTLSSSLNSSANAAVNDFCKPLLPGRSESTYLNWSRGFTIFWGLAQIGVAFAALVVSSERSIVDQVLSVAGFTTGMVLGLFILGSLWRPVDSRAALIGLVVGFGAVFTLWLPTNWDAAIVAWPWYAPVGSLTTVFVGLASNYLFFRHGPSDHRSAEPGVGGAG